MPYLLEFNVVDGEEFLPFFVEYKDVIFEELEDSCVDTMQAVGLLLDKKAMDGFHIDGYDLMSKMVIIGSEENTERGGMYQSPEIGIDNFITGERSLVIPAVVLYYTYVEEDEGSKIVDMVPSKKNSGVLRVSNKYALWYGVETDDLLILLET